MTKIIPITEAARFVTSLRRKSGEGDGGSASNSYERLTSGGSEKQDSSRHDSDPGHQSPQQESDPQVVEEKVKNAIASFAEDTQTQAAGLSVSAEGQGVGLKVVLKDRAGQVLRAMSGEEFLRLRTRSGKDTQARGKILDQKL